MALHAVGIFDDTVGFTYRSGTLEGNTGPDGQFQYIPGEDVTFSVGSLELGRAKGKPRLSVLDLVQDRSLTNPKLLNRARLLFSLTPGLGFEKAIQIYEDVSIRHSAQQLPNKDLTLSSADRFDWLCQSMHQR